MTPTEQDKELRALLGEMPYFVIDWLELSDDLRHEWKKGGKASDFGGQHAFIQKYEKKLADFITANYTPNSKVRQMESEIAWLDEKVQEMRSEVEKRERDARVEELTSLLSMQRNKPRRVLLKDAVNIAYNRVCELTKNKEEV